MRLCVVTGLFFPLLCGSAVVLDTALGDRIAWTMLTEGSRRLLWNDFWADYAASLPVSVGIGISVLLLARVVCRPSRLWRFFLLPVMAASAAAGIMIVVLDEPAPLFWLPWVIAVACCTLADTLFPRPSCVRTS